MATVFMKWLETNPKDYERGIRLITLGRITRIREKIAAEYVKPGNQVLDLGSGTGELTRMIAAAGAQVSAVDASPGMLDEAEEKIQAAELDQQVRFHQLDAAMIDEVFEPQSFDLIICSMVFSALQPELQRYLLQTFPQLLTPNGKVVIVDESLPKSWFNRSLYKLRRGALTVLTWLLTRTIFSQPLADTRAIFSKAGYNTQLISSYLGSSLTIFEAQPGSVPVEFHQLVGRLHHAPSLLTLFKDLLELFFRIMPPYPKTKAGLYAVGQPDAQSAVLVTGNYDLTVRRLVKAIDGKLNAWVLVVDTAGINVWCSAGAGYFSAEKVISAIKTARLDKVVSHKTMILPQLAANGVDGWKIREATGCEVTWGPVRAEDIPGYLDRQGQKTEDMRLVRFPLLDRLEMLTAVLSFYALIILLPVLFFWRENFWPVTLALVGIGLFYAIFLPWIPGKDGLVKSLPLSLIVLAGYLVYSLLGPPASLQTEFNWGVGLVGLSVFTAAELQGCSPLMRGEQANWIAEGIIAIVLGLIYFLVPATLGWN
ncbi:MAG: corrinoid protein-associated methyltransferase CpaM [Chloroflexota bacterium]